MTCDLDRPCTRCIKRNIGHLCHDEPREPSKKSKSDQTAGPENEPPQKLDPTGTGGSLSLGRQQTDAAGLGLSRLGQNQGNTASLMQPTPVAAQRASSMAGSSQTPLLGFQDWTFSLGSPPQTNFPGDMHSFHPQYSFGTSEVSNEYNLLNDFLTNSMLEDGAMYSNEDANTLFQQDTSFPNTIHTLNNNLFASSLQPSQSNQMLPPSQAAVGNAISRPTSGFPLDKAREAFYMTAADPAGNDSPAERLKKLMRAKYEAGLLKPFNYVKGYARLSEYMSKNLAPQSRNRIVRQLDNFRPKFRERMQALTDMQLVLVEIEFERRLMEYDRVFASMAIPACCWRRTGEIYRGNNEMAKLLGVPIEMLRDGKMAIHEIFAENSLVSYWEKFGAIAFDSSQKAILTSCSLRTRDRNAPEPELRCCFSFTIRRDTHHVPSLIVGNFLPIKAADT
ncbi:hypothetical protein, variant [Verruconis gallopava]|nr:hypothetical protein, variant [Verruconis gallopava]KIW01268.1 hypothetical protein, variant [Verruconis gallopava]